jgi:hypothetical protein
MRKLFTQDDEWVCVYAKIQSITRAIWRHMTVTLHLSTLLTGVIRDTADPLKHDYPRIISKCDIWKLFHYCRMLKQVRVGN